MSAMIIDRNAVGNISPGHLEDDDSREDNIDRNGDGNNLPCHLEDTNTATTYCQAVPQHGNREQTPCAGVAAFDNDHHEGRNDGDDPVGDLDGDGNGPGDYRNAAGVNTFPTRSGIAWVAVALLVALR
ncbi:hypothetical protein DOTSEDRAFT_35660 [Dothistroma septosporum NZE10]|uniref:Uncharacterized protein n=1 Tax=Dothistroma septosporum (strain NZE10 / CBS 128990) TaxID=675120 RepID=M2XLT9_DOTSN|nr:hypothetical protein DOTSEDRAFT_35660 [Dothistroma septosporum NZE10]